MWELFVGEMAVGMFTVFQSQVPPRRCVPEIIKNRFDFHRVIQQEAQLMLTTGSTRLAVSRGQQTWYHSTCYI